MEKHPCPGAKESSNQFMNLQKLTSLLDTNNQKFLCSSTSNESQEFTAHIFHEVTPPLNTPQIEELKNAVGDIGQLFELFGSYSSVRLYCDSMSDTSAYYIAHPNDWSELASEMNEWLSDLTEEEESEILEDWTENALVIGEIPSSGNYFLLATDGEQKGKIYSFEHDGFEFIEIAKDVEQFINQLCTINDELLDDIMCYSRYSDGETDTQWIPKKYITDA